jgi:hypothetical protein
MHKAYQELHIDGMRVTPRRRTVPFHTIQILKSKKRQAVRLKTSVAQRRSRGHINTTVPLRLSTSNLQLPVSMTNHASQQTRNRATDGKLPSKVLSRSDAQSASERSHWGGIWVGERRLDADIIVPPAPTPSRDVGYSSALRILGLITNSLLHTSVVAWDGAGVLVDKRVSLCGFSPPKRENSSSRCLWGLWRRVC